MNKEEALNIIAQLIALAPVNLQAHQAGQQALQFLKTLEVPKAPKEK